MLLFKLPGRWLLLPILLLGIWAASQWQKTSLKIQRVPPLPQDPFIQVYFNHNQAASYTEPYRDTSRSGDDLEGIVVKTIQSAQTSIDVAVQELRLPEVAEALVERQKAGVRVRLILENTYNRPWSTLSTQEVTALDDRGRDRYQEFQQLVDRNQDGQISQAEAKAGDAVLILQTAGIPWLDDTADGSAGSGLMHHKFLVVDGRKVIVTSANLTTSDVHGDFLSPTSEGNANSLVQIDNAQVASLFSQEFNLMWGDGPGGNPDSQFGLQKSFRPAQQFNLGKTTLAVQFSPTSRTIPWPQSVNGLIGNTLSRATRSVDLALFVFSEQNLANVLEADHQRGVMVRALIDPSFVYRSYSEAIDMLGVALSSSRGDTCEFEVGNHPWPDPITTVGFPQLPQGDLLHHKFGVVDQQIVIVGSHNWSDAADENNDETLLVIGSPIIAAHYQREFDRLYDQSVLGLTKTLQRKLRAQQRQCSLTPPTSPSPGIKSPSPPKSLAQKPSIPSGSRVNLNAATGPELETLPGVGPKLAQQIIQAREQQPFTSLSDLDRVPGVGPERLEKLRDRVSW